MKEVIANAMLRKDNYYNEGYLIFNGTEAKGIFTLDRVKIFSKGDHLKLLLYEADLENPMFYQSEYNFPKNISFIYSPESYTLSSKEGNLELVIYSLVNDKRKEESLRKFFSSLQI